MDFRGVAKLNFLMLISFLCLQARAESSRSVFFLDGSSQRYIRNRPLDAAGETNAMSLYEVAAATSVLLGFAPPSLLPSDSSYKLNEVLSPNPFDRPHAVMILEVSGVKGPLLSTDYLNTQVDTLFGSRIIGSRKAEIRLPDEDEVSVVTLVEPLEDECNAACVDKELSNLAHWLRGSYLGSVKSLDGELSVPLPSGSSLKLHLSKKADLHFASSLVSLFRSIKKAVEIHDDLAHSSASRAELLIGHFTGIEALEEEYGSEDITQQGVQLFQTTLAKLFDLLRTAYGGKLVLITMSNEEPSSHSGAMLDVTFSARISRWLEEESTTNSTSEVLLVRRSLAWITGVILLVSTIIGVYLLLNMPLTRDTLLYSNVKLD
ncbi:uncharacterized protein [Elaeis guineensis]|uniref:Uncharacterized protein LOC105055723 n=1 Tax=Elaeis guineensis var. tenera TaxID=51953 RepID=A0A6I9SA43_ELAGV|nr:uncharacterized protein LOC105055723 [Elaeis guineensis]